MKKHAQGQKPRWRKLVGHILTWVRYGNIYIVSGLPLLVGFLLLIPAISSMEMSAVPLHDPVGPRLLAALALFIAGFGGIFQVWRREVPGPLGGSTQGGIAVVLGWFWILIFWAAAVASLLV